MTPFDTQDPIPSRPPACRAIGAGIRAQRIRAGLTLQQLALAAGVSYQYLSGVETGKENFSIRVLDQIADALNLSLPVLLESAYAQAMPSGPAGGDVPVDGFLPKGITSAQLDAAVDHAQRTLRRIDRYVSALLVRPLIRIVQGALGDALVEEVLCAAIAARCELHVRSGQVALAQDAGGLAAPGLCVVAQPHPLRAAHEAPRGEREWLLLASYLFEAGSVRITGIRLCEPEARAVIC